MEVLHVGNTINQPASPRALLRKSGGVLADITDLATQSILEHEQSPNARVVPATGENADPAAFYTLKRSPGESRVYNPVTEKLSRNSASPKTKKIDSSLLSPKSSRKLDDAFKSLSVQVPFHESRDLDNSNNVNVYVRVKPLSVFDGSGSNKSAVSVKTANDICIVCDKETRVFTFSHVFDGSASQNEVFAATGRPAVENLLQGFNATIFAYGQTCSGKTFTMMGPDSAYGLSSLITDSSGIIPKSLEYIFQKTGCLKENEVDLVTCSFMEIYNDNLLDLLDSSNRNLRLREDTTKGVFVENLAEEMIDNAKKGMEIFCRGLSRRQTASTGMNSTSSRSHAIFTIRLQTTIVDEKGRVTKRKSCLNLVDLAGSERQKSTDATGIRLQEAGKINGSLFCLGSVINALCEQNQGKQVHIPYRDSKLTYLLKDSVGGNSKTWLIANIAPSEACAAESLSTLRFAQRSAEVKNKAKVNDVVTTDAMAMKTEISRLQTELVRMQTDETEYTSRIRDLENQLKAALDSLALVERMAEQRKKANADHLRQEIEAMKWKHNTEVDQLRMVLERKDLEVQMANSHYREINDQYQALLENVERMEDQYERTLEEMRHECDSLRTQLQSKECDFQVKIDPYKKRLSSLRDSTSSIGSHKLGFGKKIMSFVTQGIDETLDIPGVGRITPIKSIQERSIDDVETSPNTFISKQDVTSDPDRQVMLAEYETRLMRIRDNFTILLQLLDVPNAQQLLDESETADDFFQIVIESQRARHMMDKAVVVQTWYHILLGDSYYYALDSAVTRLQAHYKRKRQQRAFLRLKKATVFIQRRVSYGKSRMRKSAVERTEEIAAAMPFSHAMDIINSSIISMKANRKFKQVTDEARQGADAWELAQADRARFLLMKQAAISIQRWWRTALIKDDFIYTKQCVLSIQSAWRGYLCRRELHKRFASEIADIRNQLLELWAIYDTPLAYRSKFWTVFQESSVTSLKIHRAELCRMQSKTPSRRGKHADEDAHKEIKKERENLRRHLKAYLKLGPPHGSSEQQAGEGYKMYKCRVYFSWNINPTSKNRKGQLVKKLWRDHDSASASADLVLKLINTST